MKKEYQKRRDLLIKLLQEYFGDRVHIHGASAGMHIVAEFDNVEFTEQRINKLLDLGVYVVPVERHSLTKGSHTNQIIMGYAGLTRDDLVFGLERLKTVISV
jgi:GntR family transcriptional regulator/MocR family aminotransferase